MATATRSGILARKSPWTEEPGGVTVRGVAKSGTRLSLRSCAYT